LKKIDEYHIKYILIAWFARDILPPVHRGGALPAGLNPAGSVSGYTAESLPNFNKTPENNAGTGVAAIRSTCDLHHDLIGSSAMPPYFISTFYMGSA